MTVKWQKTNNYFSNQEYPINLISTSQHFPDYIYKHVGPNSFLSCSHANIYCVCLRVNFLLCLHFTFCRQCLLYSFPKCNGRRRNVINMGTEGEVYWRHQCEVCDWKQWKQKMWFENKAERLNPVSWVKGFTNEKIIRLKGLVWGKGLLPDSLSHASSIYAVAVVAVADLLMVILKKNELRVYATRLWSPLFKEVYT